MRRGRVATGEDGALLIRAGAQCLYEGRIALRFPTILSGSAHVRESFSDERDRFEIEVSIRNPIFGRIFGYRGWFRLEWRPCAPDEIPARAKPVREERRE